MSLITRVIDVGAPVSEVFATMADFRTLPEWDPGSIDSTQVEGDGPGVGASYKVTVEFNGKQLPMLYQTVVLEENSRIVLEGTGALVDATDDIGFEATATGTRVTYQANLRFKGLVRVVEPLFKKRFEHLGDEAAAGILGRFA